MVGHTPYSDSLETAYPIIGELYSLFHNPLATLPDDIKELKRIITDIMTTATTLRTLMEYVDPAEPENMRHQVATFPIVPNELVQRQSAIRDVEERMLDARGNILGKPAATKATYALLDEWASNARPDVRFTGVYRRVGGEYLLQGYHVLRREQAKAEEATAGFSVLSYGSNTITGVPNILYRSILKTVGSLAQRTRVRLHDGLSEVY